ncbi:unnamed protein product [Albugo candida]|uniref:5'-3' DNA helicase ZGRF1-like N-terminal domain-containing protein n=1 Tax=Albugo candida TaxID=65357 RepID=A0A024GJG0_9STRA|nr:unnamed protein product [Albugo candida]|eukprot:CCI47020.1 unnamed protein product [Albugo candida]
MVQLRKLMGTQSEGCFECMYTKHKTQKRKIWHDGYIQLNAMSRKVQLYEAVPPNGKIVHFFFKHRYLSAQIAALVEEGTLTVYQWDRGNEEYISLTK